MIHRSMIIRTRLEFGLLAIPNSETATESLSRLADSALANLDYIFTRIGGEIYHQETHPNSRPRL